MSIWCDGNIHYDKARDISVVFHLCKSCLFQQVEAKLCDESFISHGNCNWKDAKGEKGGFCSHEASGYNCHQAAVEAMLTRPKMTGGFGELQSSAHAKEQASNQKNLMSVA